MTLRTGKAAGPDEMPAEAIRADIETAVNMLCSLFTKIREKGEVPAQWKKGVIIKQQKKTNKQKKTKKNKKTRKKEKKKRKKKKKKKETLGTAATIEGSCSCQRQARFPTGFYWRG